MPPKRRTENLPPYVYKRSKHYIRRIYTGVNQPMRSVILCPIDAPVSEVWRVYEKQTQCQIKTLRWLLHNYTDTDTFKAKAYSTQKSQLAQIDRITAYKLKNGKGFGDVRLKQITAGVIRKYLDARARDGSPVAGNRDVSLISAAWNWTLERDLTLLTNPCTVVKRNPEQPRSRYVTPQEYKIAYDLVIGSPYLRPAMELAYLCRMRMSEILSARREQILEEGFDTKRLKGSNDTITRWSDRLIKAINYDGGQVKSVFIIHDKRGQRITTSAFKSAWTRLKKRMQQAGIEPFNFHDLKAAGISDFDGDKLQASGHRDPKMLKVYDRKKHIVDATE